MAISDRREIAFDRAAMLDVIASSPRMAQAMHLPLATPVGVRFDSGMSEVTLLYSVDEQSFRVPPDSLRTLLIAYCLRAGIRVPRIMKRSMRVDSAAIVLVFESNFPFKLITVVPERTRGVGAAGIRMLAGTGDELSTRRERLKQQGRDDRCGQALLPPQPSNRGITSPADELQASRTTTKSRSRAKVGISESGLSPPPRVGLR
jgi:hypothetical protein